VSAAGATGDRQPVAQSHSSAWSLIRLTPVIGDYFDGRANARRNTAPVSAIAAGLAVFGLSWLTQARQVLTSLVGGTGGYLTWLALPGGIVVFCLYVVCAREVVTPRYRYNQVLRHLAKLLAVIAVIVLIRRVREAAPVTDEAVVSGYFCREDGRPVVDATVSLTDAAGRPASDADGPDRAGYVSLPVASWSFQPLTIEVAVPGCRAITFPIDAPTAEGCSAAAGIAKRDSVGRSLPVWKVEPCVH
jgi:hypothetical protein